MNKSIRVLGVVGSPLLFLTVQCTSQHQSDSKALTEPVSVTSTDPSLQSPTPLSEPQLDSLALRSEVISATETAAPDWQRDLHNATAQLEDSAEAYIKACGVLYDLLIEIEDGVVGNRSEQIDLALKEVAIARQNLAAKIADLSLRIEKEDVKKALARSSTGLEEQNSLRDLLTHLAKGSGDAPLYRDVQGRLMAASIFGVNSAQDLATKTMAPTQQDAIALLEYLLSVSSGLAQVSQTLTYWVKADDEEAYSSDLSMDILSH